ncbi:ABC transporter ATP-binding protein [Hyphomicrobium sp.]|uniref:ABC transporter ATP-binding protein n=1 Tax=Hyphomicrobium sp. TaxID=82 RepID=UPI002BA3950A|nr:ABC transporter ATP-binding protein [Hyphomicrobium sp.]HRN89353.1 ABC transporter ATP-binding protein [Hyphomicrobium sp.]HRQ28047.1 ABC transporter ATP-binding protein [Hyphomicrobium sp.]
MAALIEADGLRKTFGAITAVDGISLAVKKGEVLGFLGPNGAGKSTTMKMIAGFLEPDSGTARICDFDVQATPKAAKTRLGYLPEGAPAYGDMTPTTFLAFIAEIRGYRGSDVDTRVAAAIGRAGLGGVVDQRIETLSKGYKRRVGIAQAILHDPPVLIMDEPTDGLDPNQKHHVRELIREMAATKAIIVSTHILEEVEAVCTRAVIINKGRIIADGTAESLLGRAASHGAVAIKVAETDAERIAKAVQDLPDVAAVETAGTTGGLIQLRALAKNGATPAKAIGELLAREQLPYQELFVERAKLDDVFRDITTSTQA